jgi:hypothetical protein
MPPDPEEGSPKRLHEERMNLPGLSYYQEFPSSEVVGFLKSFCSESFVRLVLFSFLSFLYFKIKNPNVHE